MKNKTKFAILMISFFGSCVFFIHDHAKADDIIDRVRITVPVSCTISGFGSGVYSATVFPGNSVELNGNPINIICNDNNGYDLYSIGYSGDNYEINNTDLQTSIGLEHYIHTATSGAGSYWAMKVTPSGSDMPIIDSHYDTYQTIPSVYTKIAHFEGNAVDSIITPSYKINVGSTQAAGVYNGKIKYTIVHPNNTEPPSSIVMQNLAPSRCTSNPIKVFDIRDNKEYHIQRLEDGECWMLDNLALNLADPEVQTKLTQETTNASDLSIDYLRGEKTGSINDQYATTAASTIWNNRNNLETTTSFSYSDPRIYVDKSLDTGNQNDWKYGVYYNYCAASAGSYCYGNGGLAGVSINDANEDICPSGWQLPTGGNNGNYNTLVAVDEDIVASMHLPLSGVVIEGSPSLQGASGSWWSSTRNSNDKMNRLQIGSWEIYPISNYQRSNGASIRCIMK